MNLALKSRCDHLKKSWVSCLVCITLMVGWLYSVGYSLLSVTSLIIVLAMTITFASDYSYTNYKNERKKISKRSKNIQLFYFSFALACGTIWQVYMDTFHIDALHYTIYFGIEALFVFLLFRAANKE